MHVCTFTHSRLMLHLVVVTLQYVNQFNAVVNGCHMLLKVQTVAHVIDFATMRSNTFSDCAYT